MSGWWMKGEVKRGRGKREAEGEAKKGRYMSRARKKGKPTVPFDLWRTDKH